MRLAKPDIELREQFIRDELKAHPGATVKEINAAVKKKFGMSTDPAKIAKIRDVLAPKVSAEDKEIFALAKTLQNKLSGTGFLSMAFIQNEKNKVRVLWKKAEIIHSTKEGEL